MNAHQFAIYSELLPNILKAKQIQDPDIIHRIVNVLRLKMGESFVIFNSQNNILVNIIEISKKTILININKAEQNKVLMPKITWLLPILKREAFEDALYTLTEMGAQVIQPVITTKISKNWVTHKDQARFERIIIAAAEQSKQFVLPQVNQVFNLNKWLENNKSIQANKIFFDPSGDNLFDILTKLRNSQNQEIIAIVGPEGDLTEQEKQLLLENNFIFCALTKTVLRAQQAITVALGALRSVL